MLGRGEPDAEADGETDGEADADGETDGLAEPEGRGEEEALVLGAGLVAEPLGEGLDGAAVDGDGEAGAAATAGSAPRALTSPGCTVSP